MYKKMLLVCLGMGAILGYVQPVSADLVGHWRFDESSGAVAHDSSGNGLDGSFNGDPQWVAGQMGGALEFDGDDSIEIPHNPLLSITDEITVAAWTHMNTGASGEMAVVLPMNGYSNKPRLVRTVGSIPSAADWSTSAAAVICSIVCCTRTWRICVSSSA